MGSEMCIRDRQDSTSLQRPVYLAHKQVIPGRVSVEIDALTLGPQPCTAQLLVVFPLRPFDRAKRTLTSAWPGEYSGGLQVEPRRSSS